MEKTRQGAGADSGERTLFSTATEYRRLLQASTPHRKDTAFGSGSQRNSKFMLCVRAGLLTRKRFQLLFVMGTEKSGWKQDGDVSVSEKRGVLVGALGLC